MALTRWMGRFTIGNDRKDFTVTDSTAAPHVLALTAGDYYLAGYTSEATAQLCEHMQAVIRAGNTRIAESTVTMDTDNGIVTIAFIATGGSPETCSVTWTDTGLRDLLGYTADLSGADSYTATNQAQYVWLPSKALAGYPLDGTILWQPRSTTYTHRSPDGTVFANKGSLVYDAVLEYRYLTASEVVTSATTVHESFQEFWEDVFHEGQRCRVFPDRGLNTSADYIEAVYQVTSEEPLGSFTDYLRRWKATYNGLWEVRVPLWKYV